MKTKFTVATLILCMMSITTLFAQAGGNKDGQGSGAHSALEIASNPSPDGKFTLSTDLKESSEARFRIFDMNGNQVFQKTAPGPDYVSVYPDLGSLPAGSYIAEKVVEGVRITKIIIRQ